MRADATALLAELDMSHRTGRSYWYPSGTGFGLARSAIRLLGLAFLAEVGTLNEMYDDNEKQSEASVIVLKSCSVRCNSQIYDRPQF